jgi:hypothetical protein
MLTTRKRGWDTWDSWDNPVNIGFEASQVAIWNLGQLGTKASSRYGRALSIKLDSSTTSERPMSAEGSVHGGF